MEPDARSLVGLSFVLVSWLTVLFSFVQPSSHLILCLYAKRLTHRDLLIGTQEIAIPAESESSTFHYYSVLIHPTH